MATTQRTRGAARCTDCGRAMAVWLSTGDVVHPIGCTDGCPCGGTKFRVLA
ncbi:hypothetical protein ACFO5R_03185 [Halosolutus amylolyticus]|uniref:Small CPxCG-related zinc finger protein n=1 Tax=Halosolutus amylolyticus TaxID=2932267 RepID=A0ABD5PK50_9EURY|nr:hypothetical protein [Halosolutus amylolyticus]